MGQKINPTGFRLPVTHDWTSRWYATGRDFARTLAEDLKVRDYLGKKLKNASVGRIRNASGRSWYQDHVLRPFERC